MDIKNRVAIIGAGCTKFGENYEMTYEDMVIDATYEAYEDAGVEPQDIQAAWIGTSRYELIGQRGAATSISQPLGLFEIPITRVSNYCCTGMEAVRNAALGILSGLYDVVLAVGAEKMREVGSRESLISGAHNAGHPFLKKGYTGPGLFSLLANRYFHTYGITREHLARVAVKNHHNGSLNPKAHFQMEVDVDRVLNAPLVSYPLGRLDCCPTTDGASAVILTRSELAKNFRDDPILIQGIGLNVGSEMNVFDGEFDFLGFRPTQKAAEEAYQQAGIRNPRKDIDVAEIHDCFTITEIIDYEDLGFCERGQGGDLIIDGVTSLEGDLPVNTGGGLKSYGHPIGATGVRMIHDIYKQLQGKSGFRQVKNAKTGLAHTLGGPGAIGCVFILGKQ
jgi:acetyl-CoA C-acetyltransferase